MNLMLLHAVHHFAFDLQLAMCACTFTVLVLYGHLIHNRETLACVDACLTHAYSLHMQAEG